MVFLPCLFYLYPFIQVILLVPGQIRTIVIHCSSIYSYPVSLSGGFEVQPGQCQKVVGDNRTPYVLFESLPSGPVATPEAKGAFQM